jgi:hypothetical protein
LYYTYLRFSSGLKDRFHAIGVSSSMKQHHTAEEKKRGTRQGVRSAREIHQANIDRELADDARQLEELEGKLMEVYPFAMDICNMYVYSLVTGYMYNLLMMMATYS